jgi:hypothetical protein
MSEMPVLGWTRPLHRRANPMSYPDRPANNALQRSSAHMMKKGALAAERACWTAR